MNEPIKVHQAEVVDSINHTATEIEKARQVGEAIGSILTRVQGDEKELSRSYVQLGLLLLEARNKKYWHLWGFPSFGTFIKSMDKQISKGRTQLYGYIAVSEKLRPVVGDDHLLADIGISKATLLNRAMTKTGKNPTPAIIAQAANPEVDAQELKALLFENENGSPQTGQGTYWDWGGSYVSKEEKDEIQRAFEVAKKVDPVIPVEWPDHLQRKEIMLRLCREFLATYEALVQKGIA